jgi:transmembrane sensor
MITRDEFLDLYEKCLAGQCSDAEKLLLDSYRDELRLSDNVWEEDTYTEDQVYNRIWGKLRESRYAAVPFKKNNNYIWIKAAAVLSLAGTTAWLFFSSPEPSHPVTKINSSHHPVLIKPGGNKALLTLANGSSIVLDKAQNGKLTRQSGVQVTKARDGMLIYESQKHQPVASAMEMNMITTPRGGQYQLILNDGTKVWLNAASVLKFPAQFSGKERRVDLDGEAYFEVHKNPSAPFIVHSSKQDVRVLGTHFNVKAYSDETTVRTSLLLGRVNISSGGKTTPLSPGFEAINDQGSIKVQQADVQQSTAWKNGLFQFNNATIEEVMLQVSRWYDVRVIINQGPLPLRQFTGTISRQLPITEILAMLRYTGVKFSIREKQILVQP